MKSIVKIILAGIGLGVAGFLVKREYDKSKKQVEEEKQQLKEELEEVSIDPEIYEKEIIQEDDDDNLAKKTYLSLRFDSKIDLDYLDVRKFIINDNSENVIHLRNGFDNRGNTTIDFLIEIPGTHGSYRRPTIVDYIKYFSCSKVKEELKKITGVEYVMTNLEGYYLVTYPIGRNEECEVITECISVSIPKDHFDPFADEKTDGLANYVKYLENNGHLLEKLVLDDPRLHSIDYKVVDVVILYKMSFPRKSSTRNNGLTIKKVKDVLNYLTNNEKFFVTKDGKGHKNTVIDFPYIMVNTEDRFGKWSLTHYYHYCEGKGIVIESYTY